MHSSLFAGMKVSSGGHALRHAQGTGARPYGIQNRFAIHTNRRGRLLYPEPAEGHAGP